MGVGAEVGQEIQVVLSQSHLTWKKVFDISQKQLAWNGFLKQECQKILTSMAFSTLACLDLLKFIRQLTKVLLIFILFTFFLSHMHHSKHAPLLFLLHHNKCNP
jgi:hypothetical protein